MTIRLDCTEQRILGTLIEKQLSVPDSYPMTENALVAGCNQKNNRDPITDLRAFQVAGAAMALHQRELVARVEGGGRVHKFRHKLDEALGLSKQELAVFAELLLRGAQAPGALKPRVARMGYHAEPAAIEALLRGLAEQRPPLVEQLPLGPRERDRRWRHLLGPRAESSVPRASAAPQPAPAPAAATAAPPDLASRVEALEAEVAALRRRLDELGA
ncbi:MAG: DUF480 domain-containing protein [Planctomycetes bacterium]|nr:DUF480 domain-containing protein [Planctomycetota bacterium]